MKNSIIKSAVIASVIALAVSGFAGCTKKPGQANNNAVVGITQEPGIFDPHTVVAAGDEEIISMSTRDFTSTTARVTSIPVLLLTLQSQTMLPYTHLLSERALSSTTVLTSTQLMLFIHLSAQQAFSIHRTEQLSYRSSTRSRT